MTARQVRPEVPDQLPAKIAIVGEAPGEEEVELGRPFCGPSGRVLDGLLRTAGLERADLWVGNVFSEKAPDNDVSEWIRDPVVAERARQRLDEELAEADPTVVVPMGGTALWAFTGSTQIAQARGAVQAATELRPGQKLVPTYHPALVLRQWNNFMVVVGDLIRAAREAELGPEIVWPRRSLLLEPSLEDMEAWYHEVLTSDLLSVDIETGWDQITCIGFAPSVEEAIVVPFVDLRKPDRSYWSTAQEELEAWEIVRTWMESPVPKLGQNFSAYDAYWFLDRMGIRTRNLQHDTRLLHHALYPELEKSLAFMGNSYASQGAWKTLRPKKSEKRDE